MTATTFRKFPKILQNLSHEGRSFSENFRKLPKITEDFWGRPEDVSMLHQRI